MNDDRIYQDNEWEKLVNMKIHEEIEFGLFMVMRVPHGWIYTRRGLYGVVSSFFVPKSA